jgi:hypothetical protein
MWFQGDTFNVVQQHGEESLARRRGFCVGLRGKGAPEARLWAMGVGLCSVR